MMIKEYFEEVVKDAILKAVKDNKFNNLDNVELNFMCETPKNTEFGDYAINVSMLSRYLKKAPNIIAETVKEYITPDSFEVNVINGFINFKLNSIKNISHNFTNT